MSTTPSYQEIPTPSFSFKKDLLINFLIVNQDHELTCTTPTPILHSSKAHHQPSKLPIPHHMPSPSSIISPLKTCRRTNKQSFGSPKPVEHEPLTPHNPCTTIRINFGCLHSNPSSGDHDRIRTCLRYQRDKSFIFTILLHEWLSNEVGKQCSVAGRRFRYPDFWISMGKGLVCMPT